MIDRPRPLSALTTSLLTALLSLPVPAQDPAAGMTVEQALALRSVTNVRFGDGFLAYNVVVPRPLADGPGGSYLHACVVDDLQAALNGSAKARTLVGGKDSATSMAPRPGHRTITFLKRIDDKMQLVQLAVDTTDPAEPERIATTASIVAYRWRPDGKAFAFVALDPMPAARSAARKAGFEQVVVDEDWRHRSLWLWDEGAEPRRLTEGTSVFDLQWSHDGSRLALACAPRNLVDDSYMHKRLFTVDVATGKREPLVDNPGKLGDFAWSPDDGRLAYVSADDRNDPHAGMLYVVDTATRAVTALTPVYEGMVEHVQWDEPEMSTVESRGTDAGWCMRPADPGADPAFRPLLPTPGAITEVEVQGELVAAVASTPEHPAELFLARRDQGGPATRLTRSNDLGGVAMGQQSVESFVARDGLRIEGILIKPVGWQAGRRYPLVVVAHGGPEAHFSNGWLTSYARWGQLLAARGYVSWYPNYRASTGRGTAFTKLDHGDPMGAEFDDHLDAIAHFDAQGLIDPRRVGVGGGSYGGYTAAWAATRHSEHFACAVSFVPFVDIRTKWLTSDIPWEFYLVHYQEQWPWQQPGLLADRSPLTWAEHCRTPLLLLGGTADPRVHPSQPFMLYRAVRFATETPVRYVQYPGEGHGNRTNVYQCDFALRSLRWFDWYLREGDRRTAAPPPYDLEYPLPR